MSSINSSCRRDTEVNWARRSAIAFMRVWFVTSSGQTV